MPNYICTNEECTETGIVKLGGPQLISLVICGQCHGQCQPTDDEWIDLNANPAN